MNIGDFLSKKRKKKEKKWDIGDGRGY